MSALHTTFHSLSISCNTMKNWYIIIIMLSCQFFPPLSLPTRPTFSAFKENKWFFEESSYTAVGASALRRWTTMKISFHHDCVASEDTAKIWFEANFFFIFYPLKWKTYFYVCLFEWKTWKSSTNNKLWKFLCDTKSDSATFCSHFDVVGWTLNSDWW